MNASDQLRLLPTALLITAALAMALPLAGCGGSSPSPQAAAPARESGPSQPRQPAPATPAAATPLPVSDSSSPAQATSSGPPEMTFSHTSHDFGRVSDTQDYTHIFDFLNNDSSVLDIKEVKTTCGCTSARATKDRVAPGEQGEIEVTYDPRGSGKRTYRITVLSDTGPQSQLQIQAEVDPFLVIEPRRLELGTLALHETHTALVTVLCRDPDITVESVRVGHAHIAAEILGDVPQGGNPATAERPGRSVIKLTIDERAAWGLLNTSCVITARGRPGVSEEPIEHSEYIAVSASVFGEIHADPSFFRLGIIKPGEPFEKSILLTRPSGESFQVLEATVAHSNIPGLNVRAEPAEKPGVTGHRVTLSGDLGEYLGPVRGSVKVLTDSAAEGPNEISFSGIVRSPG